MTRARSSEWEGAIASSYIGTGEALEALLDVFRHPRDKHLAYAITCALGSKTLRRHWEADDRFGIARLLKEASHSQELREPTPSAAEAEFDQQSELKTVRIACLPERMRYTVDQVVATVGQPLKIVLVNPDATDHNLVLVRPGALEEVGLAANAMARDPRNAQSDFIPESKRSLILAAAPMIGPTREAQVHVLRIRAPESPGIYPYVCTFPGHWVVMKGELVVARDLKDVPAMLAARKPRIVRKWKVADFEGVDLAHPPSDDQTIMRGMQAYQKARCNQCHAMGKHGATLGPDLLDVAKRHRGVKLLRQILQPSSEIHEKFKTHRLRLTSGEEIVGMVARDLPDRLEVVKNLLLPQQITTVMKSSIEVRRASQISPMPEGMADTLTQEEILNLLAFLEHGGYQLPDHLKKSHSGHKE